MSAFNTNHWECKSISDFLQGNILINVIKTDIFITNTGKSTGRKNQSPKMSIRTSKYILRKMRKVLSHQNLIEEK